MKLSVTIKTVEAQSVELEIPDIEMENLTALGCQKLFASEAAKYAESQGCLCWEPVLGAPATLAVSRSA